MQIRHRAPTIFSIYMVDVLCCALGCVVLMWQFNLNAAEEKAAAEKTALEGQKSALEKLAEKAEAEKIALERLAQSNILVGSSAEAKKRLEALLAEQKKTHASELKAAQERFNELLAALTDQNNKLAAGNTTLKKELDDKSAQYIQLNVELTKARADGKLMLAYKKDYDDAKAAEVLARKLLDALRVDFDKLTLTANEYKKINAADLAKLTDNAAIILELNKKIDNLVLVHKKDYDEAKAAEANARKAAEDLTKLLTALRSDIKSQTETAKKIQALDVAALAEKAAIINDLNKKIADAELQLAGLKKDVQKWQTDAEAANIQIGKTKISLQDSVARTLKLEAMLTQLQTDLKQSKSRSDSLDQDLVRVRAELADSKKRHQDLMKVNQELTLDYETLRNLARVSKKELEDAQLSVKSLELKNLSAHEKYLILKRSVESRFAGITLTGSKVIFLVDMSGSMAFVDEDNPDPDKWPIVCETVGRIMQSLPDLQKYQVILFSNGVTYPLGNEGRWLEFDKNKSVEVAVKALKAVTPAGGTNIHAALAEVFKFRKLGLDSVYFFSDGLANLGDGIPKDPEAKVLVGTKLMQVKKMTEQLKAEYLRTIGPLPANSDVFVQFGGRPKEVKDLTEPEKGEVLGNHVRKVLWNDWNRPVQGWPRVKINTIGFFYESPDVGSFLWALSREHDGSFVGMSKP